MKLAEFQSLFQARILAGAGDADAPLIDALRESLRGAERATLLDVYQSGYRARLGGFLAEDHPGLRELLGEQRFDALIEAYIAAHPPRHRNARWYTTGLPDYMRENAAWKDDRRAISMALFERALVDAFDVADMETLDIQTLSTFSPEEWPNLVFAFHPSVILLELSAGTLAAYGVEEAEDIEMAEAGAPASDSPPVEDGVEAVAVWRVNEESAFRALEPDEYVALSEAKAGQAFGDICQMAAFQQSGEMDPARLAQFLASWFEEGMVVGASVRT